jgi:O-antigen/teichoic acid export membrane protein
LEEQSREPVQDKAPGKERRTEVLGTAKSAGINFVGSVFNQILHLGMTLMLSRLLGATGVGRFYTAFAFLALLLQAGAGGGIRTSMTRYVAVHLADRDTAALRGTVRLGLALATLSATLMGAVLFLAAPWLANVAFDDPQLTLLLRLVAIALPATVFTDCALSATQGFKTMVPYAAVNLFFEPSFRLGLTAALLLYGFGLTGVMVALVITNWTAALLATFALRRLMRGAKGPGTYSSLRELFSFTAVSWVTSLASNGLIWAGTLMLGLYVSAAQVGIYQLSARLLLLATIFIQPVTTSFAPRVADLHRRGRWDSLRDTYVRITSWIFRLALPSFIVLTVFPRELLAIFGPEFRSGATVTIILALGQLVNSTTGPCGYMLLMSGRQILQMINNVAAVIISVLLNLWLIPRYGIVGAAASWSVAIAGFNIVRVVQVKVLMGMLPVDKSLWKGLTAGVVATIIGLTVAALTDGFVALVAGSAAILLAYFGALTLLGIDADDRLVLASLRRKFGLGGRASRRSPSRGSL